MLGSRVITSRQSYLPNFVPSYCEEMYLKSGYYHKQLKDHHRIYGMILAMNDLWDGADDSKAWKQLVYICKGCWDNATPSGKVATVEQLFNSEEYWQEIVGNLIESMK